MVDLFVRELENCTAVNAIVLRLVQMAERRAVKADFIATRPMMMR
jgi:hypothetical protein